MWLFGASCFWKVENKTFKLVHQYQQGHKRQTCGLLDHIAEEGMLSHPGRSSTLKTSGYCSSIKMDSTRFHPHHCMVPGLVRPFVVGRGLGSQHRLRVSLWNLWFPTQPFSCRPIKEEAHCTALVSSLSRMSLIPASGGHVTAHSCTQHVH